MAHTAMFGLEGYQMNERLEEPDSLCPHCEEWDCDGTCCAEDGPHEAVDEYFDAIEEDR